MKKIIIVAVSIFVIAGVIAAYSGYSHAKPTSETAIMAPDIRAKEAILIDQANGEILYEKNKSERAYPASTTKILTCLLALEICQKYDINLKTEVKVPEEAVGVEGSAIYLKAGDEISIETLLYGSMLRSGNDGATALAIILGGSEENFVRLMNIKATALGCTGSSFANPTGLQDEKHYTTAEDLSKISRAAMKNKDFRRLVGVKKWESYVNKNKTIFQYEGGTGVKIGFTKTSGRTLVASAKRQGVELIAVVLNDGNWFKDAYNLLDYGFYIRGIKLEK